MPTASTAPAARLVIGLDELASVMSITPDKLKRRWLRLHLKHGMPRKHSAGWFWPRALTEAWLVTQSALAAPAGNDNTFGNPPAQLHADRAAEQRASLRQLYGGQA